jgi:hypothetical protein
MRVNASRFGAPVGLSPLMSPTICTLTDPAAWVTSAISIAPISVVGLGRSGSSRSPFEELAKTWIDCSLFTLASTSPGDIWMYAGSDAPTPKSSVIAWIVLKRSASNPLIVSTPSAKPSYSPGWPGIRPLIRPSASIRKM